MIPSAFAAIAWRMPAEKAAGSPFASKSVIFQPTSSPASLAAFVATDALSPICEGEMIHTFLPRGTFAAVVGGSRSVPA